MTEPKAKPERPRYRIGQVFYRAVAYDDGTCEVEELRIRTIRKPYVYAIPVNKWTWGKRSTKHGDVGWLDPIFPLYRVRFYIDPGADYMTAIRQKPDDMKATKAAAIRHFLADKRGLSFYEEDARTKAVRTFKAMLTRELNRKKKD